MKYILPILALLLFLAVPDSKGFNPNFLQQPAKAVKKQPKKIYKTLEEPAIVATVTIPIETFEKAMIAAQEVAVSRDYIAVLESENKALKERVELDKQAVKVLEELNALKDKQIAEYKLLTSNLMEEQRIFKDKVAKLERSNKRLKKLGKILGGVAAGAIFVLVR